MALDALAPRNFIGSTSPRRLSPMFPQPLALQNDAACYTTFP
jgi:hypothetical protein